jgi:hypothetical protein
MKVMVVVIMKIMVVVIMKIMAEVITLDNKNVRAYKKAFQKL